MYFKYYWLLLINYLIFKIILINKILALIIKNITYLSNNVNNNAK